MKGVYLKAAESIDLGISLVSCVAVADVVDPYKNKEIREIKEVNDYENIFSPYIVGSPLFWGNLWGENNEECKECRVLALLFMHWISEGDK